MSGQTHGRPETATLLSDVVTGLGRLVRGELMLARAEAAEGLKQAGGGVAKLVVSALVGLVGLNVLAGAAVAALSAAGLGQAWAALIVAAALMVLALLLAMAGRSALRLRSILPDRALRGLRRDAEAVHSGLKETGVRHV